ncbi:MAG: bifunctional lysine ketoglutarate reductase /saccharopine dehydrogenase family protein [Anaerolineae bacterium]
MQRCIGVRREDKSHWERRVPITPIAVRTLAEQGIQVFVQPSLTRAYRDEEFAAAGALVQEDISACPVVFGVKEIPPAFFRPGGAYVFFAHVIKGQPHNMPMLRRMLELGCTLIDYEKVTDEHGRRLIFFGRHAGLAGTIETLWALGKRLAWRGIETPFARLHHAREYHDLAEAQAAVAEVGEAIRADGLPASIAPLTVGVTGYGNVARGAWEILNLLPVQVVEPGDLAAITVRSDAARDLIYGVTFREEHMVTPRDGLQPFDCQRYYDCPDNFRPIFERFLPHLTVMINGIYWDARYPRLVTKEGLRRLAETGPLRLQVIGDISCDIEGSVEITVKTTDPGQPVFVYDPLTGNVQDGYEGEGVVVMAVDILPSELPRDASESFSTALLAYIPAIAAADYNVPFEELALPPEIKRAVIAHRGQLTPPYQYLQRYLT